MDLWDIVEAALRREQMSLAPDCEDLLKQFVRRGEERLRSEARAPAPVADRQLYLHKQRFTAEENLFRFVHEMVIEARQLRLSELHEPTFHAAVARICPVWPFC